MRNEIPPGFRVRAALASCRRHFFAAAAFSAVSNILYLTPSLYMLQVYDRVVPTGGLATLAALSLIALFALAALAVFEWLRSRLLVRASAQLEATLGKQALSMAMRRPDLDRLDRSEMMRWVDTLRQGIASPGAVAAMDAPWTPIYVIVAFLLHPWLGMLTLAGGIVLLMLAWQNERATSAPLKRAGEAASIAHARQVHSATYSGEVRALGMVEALSALQSRDRQTTNALQLNASFAGGNYSALIKFLRTALQSAGLAVGAVLAVEGAISPGAIIAATLLLARALAPIEQIVGGWKSIVESRAAYEKLERAFAAAPEREHTLVPAPKGELSVERVTVLMPGTDRIAIADISFEIPPGQIVGIIGSSGAGKSTLLRALAGALPIARGHVRLDGISRADWDPEQIAQHIGYLPQDSVLFPGTIKQNIARFSGNAGRDAAEIDALAVAAAQAAGAHDMIARLAQGYDTPVGPGGAGLSAGQAQLVALARALFGNPSILLLDEPTAHLDADAQQRFSSLLGQLRVRGVSVLYSSHSVDALAGADKLLVLTEGRVQRFATPLELRPAETTPARRPVSYSVGNFRR